MKSAILTLLVALTGCSSLTKSGTINSSDREVAIDNPQIIFVICLASISEDSTMQIELVDRIITEGKFKETNTYAGNIGAFDMICIQLDDNSLSLDTTYIPHPLIRSIEFVDAQGSLNKNHVQLDRAEFFIRMQLNPNTRSISIQKPGDPNITPLKFSL